MKNCVTNVEQSRTLCHSNIDTKFASMVYVCYKDPWNDNNYELKPLPNGERGCWKIPAFTIDDMMRLLPKLIPDRKNPHKEDYKVELILGEGNYKFSIRRSEGDCLCGTYVYDNFIDALYDIFLFCVNNNYLDKQYYEVITEKGIREYYFLLKTLRIY